MSSTSKTLSPASPAPDAPPQEDESQIATNLRYARGLIRKAASSGASFVDINVSVLRYLVENRRHLNDQLRWAQERAAAAELRAASPSQEAGKDYAKIAGWQPPRNRFVASEPNPQMLPDSAGEWVRWSDIAHLFRETS